MKNKITGQIVDLTSLGSGIRIYDKGTLCYCYRSIDELCREWADVAEKPGEYYYLEPNGSIQTKEYQWFNQAQEDIGNIFKTKEEAEKAVEKLKALKRLQDVGFEFTGYGLNYDSDDGKDAVEIHANLGIKWYNTISKDLNVLFGGKN